VGEGGEFGRHLAFKSSLAALQLLDVSLVGGGRGTLEGFGVHSFEVGLVEGAAIGNGLSLRGLAGVTVKIIAFANKASFKVVHVFSGPRDDIAFLSLLEQYRPGVFAEVVGLDSQPIVDAGVGAVHFQDAVVIRCEVADEGLLDGVFQGGTPGVEVTHDGFNGSGTDGAMGRAGVLAARHPDGVAVSVRKGDAALFEAAEAQLPGSRGLLVIVEEFVKAGKGLSEEGDEVTFISIEVGEGGRRGVMTVGTADALMDRDNEAGACEKPGLAGDRGGVVRVLEALGKEVAQATNASPNEVPVLTVGEVRDLDRMREGDGVRDRRDGGGH